MADLELPPSLAPLRQALVDRGFEALTPVQAAVLAPELAGKDLRISSRTGSGKTVALGLVVAPLLLGAAPSGSGCRPRALVVAPTRELAAQVAGELGWLFAPLGVGVAAVTGGTSVLGERRALAKRPGVVVATPGRLLDHLEHGAITPTEVGAIVLDEADQLLDLGFREALEQILERMPAERRTHLVSATFAPNVLGLAQRYQQSVGVVQATPTGSAHADIEHVIHPVARGERFDALVNVLLLAPEELTLIFVRTRAGCAELAQELVGAGFTAASLSGDMEQRERTRTLDAFRAGTLKLLVATDVAARGIDVLEIARVIHFDPADDPDTYTHRSGRTGRAGRKGRSLSLCEASQRRRVTLLLERARTAFTVEPVPTRAELVRAAEERLVTELSTSEPSPKHAALVERLLASAEPAALLGALLERVRLGGPARPRNVTPVIVTPARTDTRLRDQPRRSAAPERFKERPPRAPFHEGAKPRPPRPAPDQANEAPPRRPPRPAPEPFERRPSAPQAEDYASFSINWGTQQGADARRRVALLCRRGDIRGADIGAIRVGPRQATFQIARGAARRFAERAQEPDARDPRLVIRPFQERAGAPPHLPSSPFASAGPFTAPAAPRRGPAPPPEDAPPRRAPRPRDPGARTRHVALLPEGPRLVSPDAPGSAPRKPKRPKRP